MKFFSWIRNPDGTLNRWVYFILVAIVVAAGTLALLRWTQAWNYPSTKYLETTGKLVYRAVPIEITVQCDCPEVLTENVPRVLTFTFHLKRSAAAPDSDKWGGMYMELSAGSATVDPQKSPFIDSDSLFKTPEINKSVAVKIQPSDATLSEVIFQFTGENGTPLGTIPWGISSHASSRKILAPFLYSAGVFAFAVGILFWADRQSRRLKQRYERESNEARLRAEQNPKDARYAWNLAKVTLEQYFGRNLIQVNLVFWVAVFVMSIGFIFIMVGVLLSFHQPTITPPSWVSAISGLITQFIGATFMVIYKSTMAQASEFVTVLDRINRVGMAVQVLDAIDEGELKNQTRASIATSLLAATPPKTPPTSSSTDSAG